MNTLNFPTYKFQIKNKENKLYIFDIVRKKYVVITPEEWVRQHVIHYLIKDKGYPKSLIGVEKEIKVNSLKKRFDILAFNTSGTPKLLVECKAPHIKITQETFNQISIYNLSSQANLLMVTNGIQHYYCSIDYENKQYLFIEKLPNY